MICCLAKVQVRRVRQAVVQVRRVHQAVVQVRRAHRAVYIRIAGANGRRMEISKTCLAIKRCILPFVQRAVIFNGNTAGIRGVRQAR